MYVVECLEFLKVDSITLKFKKNVISAFEMLFSLDEFNGLMPTM
jgi:hypothetical protein